MRERFPNGILALIFFLTLLVSYPIVMGVPILDQSFTFPGNTMGVAINECCKFVAQTFTAGLTGTLAGVKIHVRSVSTFFLHVAIRTTTNGLPNPTVLGETNLPTGNAPRDMLIEFPQRIEMVAGVQYAIVVNYEGAPPPGHLQEQGIWDGEAALAPTDRQYPRGAPYLSRLDGISWEPVLPPNYDGDLHFQTYVEAAPGPIIQSVGNKSVDEEAPLAFTVTANDPDPEQMLTLTSSALPLGATFVSTPASGTVTGAFSWTPDETQGPGSYGVTFTASDSRSPTGTDSETVTITVNEVNTRPVLVLPGAQTADEGTPLSFTVSAVDHDIPANTVTRLCDNCAELGATFDTSTGVFSWTPSEVQGTSDHTATFTATDDGSPPLSDMGSVVIHVGEVNLPPVLAPIGDLDVDEEGVLTFTASAADPDNPANALTFSLGSGAPEGASITAGGVFTWTPTEAQGTGTYTVTIRVTDNGTPALSDFETITISVNEVNKPPVLAPIGAKVVDEQTLLTFTVAANDPDVPLNALTFSCNNCASIGASITPEGVFSWTPTVDQRGSSYTMTIIVSDGSLTDAETITVTVGIARVPPAPTPWWVQYWYLILIGVAGLTVSSVYVARGLQGKEGQVQSPQVAFS